ncbi:MAG: hypothetical protein QG653_75 [Patescibacteria group bacterium]|nr:hypothetical protein [Patescibacteria group bacterium]
MALIAHHHFIDKLAFLNGFISGVALYPQVWKLFTFGSTEGVSFVSFLIIFINSIVWLIYAVHRELISLAVASILNIVASGILTVAIMLATNN